MAKAASGSMWRIFLVYLPLFLDFCGWVLMLSGVAALQARCGSVPPQDLATYGSIAYLPGQISCDKFFRYTWWIVFFQLFVWLLILLFLFTRSVHKIRGGLLALLATVTVLVMDTANVYLYFKDQPTSDSVFNDRAKVLFAGALITAVANGLLMLGLGWHNERKGWGETGRKQETTYTTAGVGGVPPGTTPVATGVQSTTAATAV